MVRKKIDNRIRILIENGVKLGHRTLLAIVGDKGRDQVSVFENFYVTIPFIVFYFLNSYYLGGDSTPYAIESRS